MAVALGVAVVTLVWTVFSDWTSGGGGRADSLPALGRGLLICCALFR